jgi:hypothetical protein
MVDQHPVETIVNRARNSLRDFEYDPILCGPIITNLRLDLEPYFVSLDIPSGLARNLADVRRLGHQVLHASGAGNTSRVASLMPSYTEAQNVLWERKHEAVANARKENR